jgi:hypothetical protein
MAFFTYDGAKVRVPVTGGITMWSPNSIAGFRLMVSDFRPVVVGIQASDSYVKVYYSLRTAMTRKSRKTGMEQYITRYVQKNTE